MHQTLVMCFQSVAPPSEAMISGFVTAFRLIVGDCVLSGEIDCGKGYDITKFDQVEPMAGNLTNVSCTDRTTMVFGDSIGNSARIDLVRLERSGVKFPAKGKDANYQAHVFEMELDTTRLRRSGWELLFNCFTTASVAVDAVFAAADLGRLWTPRLNSSRGPESGIPGVFPMTCLGHAYVSLVGKDRVHALDAHRSVALKNGSHAFEFEIGSREGTTKESLEVRARSAWGDEHFSECASGHDALTQGGRMGLLSLLGSMLHSNLSAKSQLAKRRPELDWSGVFKGPL